MLCFFVLTGKITDTEYRRLSFTRCFTEVKVLLFVFSFIKLKKALWACQVCVSICLHVRSLHPLHRPESYLTEWFPGTEEIDSWFSFILNYLTPSWLQVSLILPFQRSRIRFVPSSFISLLTKSFLRAGSKNPWCTSGTGARSHLFHFHYRREYWKEPSSFGYNYCPFVLFAVGMMMCLEAFASALYHVCPNPRALHIGRSLALLLLLL